MFFLTRCPFLTVFFSLFVFVPFLTNFFPEVFVLDAFFFDRNDKFCLKYAFVYIVNFTSCLFLVDVVLFLDIRSRNVFFNPFFYTVPFLTGCFFDKNPKFVPGIPFVTKIENFVPEMPFVCVCMFTYDYYRK